MARQRTDQHERHRDRVQHAEPDVAARKHEVAADADQHRARGHLRDVAPEARAAARRALRQHEARAGEQQERREDQRARREPERVAVEVGTGDAEPGQVEAEVECDHRDDGETAQRVDRGDPARGGIRHRGRRAARRAGYRASLRHAMRTAPEPSGVPSAVSARATWSGAPGCGVTSTSALPGVCGERHRAVDPHVAPAVGHAAAQTAVLRNECGIDVAQVRDGARGDESRVAPVRVERAAAALAVPRERSRRKREPCRRARPARVRARRRPARAREARSSRHAARRRSTPRRGFRAATSSPRPARRRRPACLSRARSTRPSTQWVPARCPLRWPARRGRSRRCPSRRPAAPCRRSRPRCDGRAATPARTRRSRAAAARSRGCR